MEELRQGYNIVGLSQVIVMIGFFCQHLLWYTFIDMYHDALKKKHS